MTISRYSTHLLTSSSVSNSIFKARTPSVVVGPIIVKHFLGSGTKKLIIK